MSPGTARTAVQEASADIVGPLLESAEDFLSRRHQPSRCKGPVGIPRPVDLGMWSDMAELGWTGLLLPERLGGAGLDLLAAASLCEFFGRAIVPEPLVASAVIPAVLLTACPDADTVRQLCGAVAGGRGLLTLAWQDRISQLTAEFDSVQVVGGRLHGERALVPVAGDAAILLVPALGPAGPALFAVDAGATGVSRQVLSAGLSSCGSTRFEAVQPMSGAPLLEGDAAADVLRAALEAGTVCIAAQLSGIAAGALGQIVHYVSGRVQFGRPIGSFQSIQHRCADLYIESQLADAAWKHAARVGGATAISAAKARCGDAALAICREAIQMHGAMGFTEEADVGLYLRSALHLNAWLGMPRPHRRRFLTEEEPHG